ncbi:MAG: hypothetical protein HRU38_23040, partial [Saccharospirillaceae bacterium]|nr:hypothetical protein [Saccharospirillaceae bacterium]
RGFGHDGKKGDGKEDEVAISHSDVLSTCATRAGYTGIVLPQTDALIDFAWTGGSTPTA